MNTETLIIKNRTVNVPHILSSGVYDTQLIGESDTEATEQQLTLLPLGIRSPRGSIRVLLQMEYKFGLFVDHGKGSVNLYHSMVGDTGFHIHAVHDLEDGVSRSIRIHWFAFGYEDYEASPIDLTSPPAPGDAIFHRKEDYSGITTTITLQNVPVNDPTLIVWADRIPMFYGTDFTVSGSIIEISPALTGEEAVTVTYRSKV